MLHKSSAEAFKRALVLYRSQKIETDAQYDILDKILLNYGRVLAKLKQYDEALANFNNIKKVNIANQCEKAFTYFRAELFEKAYSLYETTLRSLATDDETTSHLLVAMAAAAYLYQGPGDAKWLLLLSYVFFFFSSIYDKQKPSTFLFIYNFFRFYDLKPSSVHGLFACCALGMLHSDLGTSELALNELNVYKNDPLYLDHIVLFQSYIHLFKVIIN